VKLAQSAQTKEAAQRIDDANSPASEQPKRGPWRPAETRQFVKRELDFLSKVEQKCEEIASEMQKEAEKECTFKPKITPYQSTAERPSFEEGLLQDVKKREQNLRDLEAAVREKEIPPQTTPRGRKPVTPPSSSKDTPGAKRIDLTDDKSDTVHSRLAVRRERSPRSRMRDKMQSWEEECTFQPTFVSGARGVKRTVQTTELLYSDAVDRWHRRRVQVAMMEEDETSQRQRACRVSARTRKYVWRGLEKQIKQAFDAVTGSESGRVDSLAYVQLPLFLEKLGCLPKLKDDDQRQLILRLWEQLDPHSTGKVDILSLTVFFHVLLGAVEGDAAHGARDASADEASVHRPPRVASWE
jgi:hypothetical protein